MTDEPENIVSAAELLKVYATAVDEALARIAELEKDQRDSADVLLIAHMDGYHEAVKASRARIAELEAALKPFAYDYGDYSDGMWSDLDYIQVSVGDLRAARAALGEKE